MRIDMQAGGTRSEIASGPWGHAILGTSVDPRGEAAAAYVRDHCGEIHRVNYDAKNLEFRFDGVLYSVEEPEYAVSGIARSGVLVEATTLGFVELLLCVRALKNAGASRVSFLYCEPGDYYRPRRSMIVHRRDFELSSEVEQFTAVPGNAILLLQERAVKAVVFLGFEGQRLNRLLEQTGIRPGSCEYVFGVPAFRPGWEMDAFANNVRVIGGEGMAGRVHFCGAHSPMGAYEVLRSVHRSCDGRRFAIVPIGTKPHGIGAALFLSEEPDVGVVYDCPRLRAERSDSVGTWHLFNVAL